MKDTVTLNKDLLLHGQLRSFKHYNTGKEGLRRDLKAGSEVEEALVETSDLEEGGIGIKKEDIINVEE